MPSPDLYQPHELAFRTQYAELKDRVRSTAILLRGTPGSLVKRTGTGRSYWSRVYQTAAGMQAEDLVGREGDEPALLHVRSEIEFAQWVTAQVRNLRKLQFQIADKGVASVLIELYNKGVLAAGLSIVGTLGYMAWLNELGARAVSGRTQDIDLAARQKLKLAAQQSFLETIQATKLGFVPVPGLPNQAPPTSVKLKGREGLRIDVLTHGKNLGACVPIPELMWHAQSVPHYDYLLSGPREAAILAGGHCIPILLPQPERFVWHKLYSSASRLSFPEKANKDLLQAATLAAVLTEREDHPLSESFADVPAAMKSVLKKRMPALRRALNQHPLTLDAFEQVLT
jgi:hypothetical protein